MDPQLSDPWISRVHCELYELEATVIIRDLGSRYGTFLNGLKVEESVLRPRDKLTLGLTRLEITYQRISSPAALDSNDLAVGNKHFRPDLSGANLKWFVQSCFRRPGACCISSRNRSRFDQLELPSCPRLIYCTNWHSACVLRPKSGAVWRLSQIVASRITISYG